MKSNQYVKWTMGMMAVAFLASGCASDGGKKLDQKLTQEAAPANSAALAQEAQKEIDQDSKLTPEQKAKLTKLRAETSAELKNLREQSLQLRDLIVKDFLSENDQEMDLLQTRLQKNSDRQVSLIFQTVRKANRIIGHNPRRREWIDRAFIERDHF